MKSVSPIEVLLCPMQQNDAHAATVGQYLIALSRRVWVENEGFSGKHPFGNSGWDYEVFEALGAAGYIDVDRDKWGDETYDEQQAGVLIKQAYEELHRLVSR